MIRNERSVSMYGWARTGITCAVLLALVVLPAAMPAQEATQDEKNLAAYVAMSFTPIGALPPLLTRSMAGGRAPSTGGPTLPTGFRPQVAFRYGRGTIGDGTDDDLHLNSFAATGLISAGEAATLAATIGRIDPDCSDPECNGEWMFSFGGDVALGGRDMGTTPGSPRLTFGLNGELGFMNADDGNALSLVGGLPIALVASSGTMRIVPFLIPSVGYGRMSANDPDVTEGAMRFLLGGGISLLNIANAVSVNVGFQKIFFKVEDDFGNSFGSKTMFGASITLGN